MAEKKTVTMADAIRAHNAADEAEIELEATARRRVAPARTSAAAEGESPSLSSASHEKIGQHRL